MNNHICGDPNSACDAECMERAHRAELRTKDPSDTPRTDAAIIVVADQYGGNRQLVVPAEFAGQLERELNEAKSLNATLGALESSPARQVRQELPVTKDLLRQLLREHIRQPSGRRNPGHSVVAIYLGREEFMSLVDQRDIFPSIQLRGDMGDITFDGVPVYRVNDANHVRIVSEYVEP